MISIINHNDHQDDDLHTAALSSLQDECFHDPSVESMKTQEAPSPACLLVNLNIDIIKHHHHYIRKNTMKVVFQNNNLLGLPWHACAPIGKGDWGCVRPGKSLVRGFTVSLTTKNCALN